jgi:hypothetical protein
MKRIIVLGIAVVAMALLVAPRSNADSIFTATLLGVNEVPPNGSFAFGIITVTLTGDLLSVNESFAGLTSNAVAAHIHCCTLPGTNIGVAIPFFNFPNTTSGTYTNTFDLSNSAEYTATFLAANGGTAVGAEAALIAGLDAGMAYANIHDSVFPSGEIRGQLELLQVPEAGTITLLLSGILGLGLLVGLQRAPGRNL